MIIDKYKTKSQEDNFSLDDFFKANIPDYNSLKKHNKKDSVREYFSHFKDVFNKSLRIEVPCISACELGEVGFLPLFQTLTSNYWLGQAGSLGMGAIAGGTLATMTFIGEQELEMQEHHHHHDHECDHHHDEPSLEELLKQTTVGYHVKRTGKAFKEGVKTTYNTIRHEDKDKRRMFHDRLKTAGITTLFAEIFGCIGAAELSAFTVGTLVGGTSLTFTNPVFWAVWGSAIIPAYLMGSSAVALKLGKDEFNKTKNLYEFCSDKNQFDNVYEIAKKHFNCTDLKNRKFSINLDDEQEIIVKQKTPDSVKNVYDHITTMGFRMINKESDLIQITCKNLHKKDARKDIYSEILKPFVTDLENELKFHQFQKEHDCSSHEGNTELLRKTYGNQMYTCLGDAINKVNSLGDHNFNYGDSLNDSELDLKKAYKQMKKLYSTAKKEKNDETVKTIDSYLNLFGRRRLWTLYTRQAAVKGKIKIGHDHHGCHHH